MHTHENCDQRLDQTDFVTVLQRAKNLNFEGVVFKYLKTEKRSDSTWFSDHKKSPLFTTGDSGIGQVNSWGTKQPTKIGV